MKSLDLAMTPPPSPTTPSRSGSIRQALHLFHHKRDSSTPPPSSASSRSSGTSRKSSYSNDVPSKKALRKEEKRQSQDSRRHESELSREELLLRRRKSSFLAAEEGPVMRARYGVLQPNIYTQWQGNEWRELARLSAVNVGETLVFRARVHTLRKLSSRMLFLVLRQQVTTMQAVLSEEADVVSAHMVHSASRLALEDIVTVKGVVQRPRVPITGASITDAEV
jgi:ergosteryl-3beta-O-L-aspartate synthase